MRIPPTVTLREIPWVTPTMYEELESCPLRAAFRADPSFRPMRRPNIPAALGTVSHKLAERTARGAFDAVPVGSRSEALAEAWDALIRERYETLSGSARFGTVPLPSRWPGYQLLRVRTLRRLEEELTSTGRERVGGTLHVEQRLEDEVTRVAGSPDRVERSDGGVEIIDLKTGWRVGDDLKASHRRQLLLYAFLWHAVHDEWPRRVSVQRLDGTRITLDVDPSEARVEAEHASQALARFNALVTAGADPDALARPSEAACRNCDYRGACGGFLRQPSDGWPGRRRTLAGSVVGVEDVRTGATIDLGEVVGGCSGTLARVVVPERSTEAQIGSWCVFTDAIPVTETDFRVDWETGLFVRDS